MEQKLVDTSRILNDGLLGDVTENHASSGQSRIEVR